MKILRIKICKILWILYAIIYLWLWGAPHYWSNSLDFYIRLAVALIILTGIIGYITQLRIAYKIIWRVLFLILLFIFSFSLIVAVISERSGLLMLILLLPALYALYAYAYRSKNIWEKKQLADDLSTD